MTVVKLRYATNDEGTVLLDRYCRSIKSIAK